MDDEGKSNLKWLREQDGKSEALCTVLKYDRGKTNLKLLREEDYSSSRVRSRI